MLRWIFGWGEEKKQVKKTVNPAQRWVSDTQGGYVKHSTAKAIASFAGETAPGLAQQAPAGLGANGLVDDSGIPYGNEQDALSAYQTELSNTAADLQASLAKWMEKKVEVIGSDTDLAKYADSVSQMHPGSNLIEGIYSLFNQLFENIKAGLVPASTELHQLLEAAHGHVQSLCDHIDASCQKLDEKDRLAEDKRRICVDICNDSIQIVNDLIAMIDNIKEELEYCLKFEGLTEEAAMKLTQLAILIVLKVPMPELDFNFKLSYRHFLYNEIEGEKKEIELFETDVKGHLLHAMNEITAIVSNRDITIIPSAEEKPESDLLSGSLFAPTPNATPSSTPDSVDYMRVANSRL